MYLALLTRSSCCLLLCEVNEMMICKRYRPKDEKCLHVEKINLLLFASGMYVNHSLLNIGILQCICIQQGNGHLYHLYRSLNHTLKATYWQIRYISAPQISSTRTLKIKLLFAHQVVVWHTLLIVYCSFIILLVYKRVMDTYISYTDPLSYFNNNF